MTTRVKTLITTALDLPTYEATVAEQEILAISSLQGWFEARHGIESENGFRWQDRISTNRAYLLNQVKPLVVTGTNGEDALQMSYGSADFATTERGAMRPNSHKNLIGVDGFTIISCTRVPTVASGDSATLGGYVWSSRGASGNNTPGLNISGSTGRPNFRAGGALISNPAGFDARTGNWHVIRCEHDIDATQIRVAIDRTRAVGSAGSAGTAPDDTVSNMLAPIIGGFLNTSGVFGTPFYGQIAAILFFDGILTSGELASVEDYLEANFGATLV